jgi:BirA family biotin operon repressor/biotin-[acetyl-CoA-carboxylase] ligase
MKALGSGAGIDIFQELDSTSLEAKRRAERGAEKPVWILALRQRAGYGRRGSAWMQNEGDVAATLLFAPKAPGEKLPQLSFVAALAVFDSIRRYAPRANVAVKWPNDILIDGKKIAGLLLELVGPPNATPIVALGVGVNIVSAPEIADYPTAKLIDYSVPPPSPYEFVNTLDEAFAVWRLCWETRGFPEIRSEWLSRAARLGERVAVRSPNETILGVFEDLDSEGNLILSSPEGRRLIAAGAILPPGRQKDRDADRH